MAIDITAENVIGILQKVGVRPVLMGTHGIGGYRSAWRATDDVDILLRKKDIAKAVRTLKRSFPTLVITDTPVVTRFVDPEKDIVVIDVMKPTQPIYKLVFKNTIPVGDTHDIPDLEMALVSKFAAMTSPYRIADKKMIDGGDFINMVRKNRKMIDMRKLDRLANSVYPEGGKEILFMIGEVDAGRTLHL